MVLCPLHHSEAGVMDEEEQRELKRNPYNIQHGLALGFLRVKQNYAAVEIGTVQLVGDFAGVTIDGDDVFVIKVDAESVMKLSAKIYDANNMLIAEILDNEWISGNPMAWDIRATWTTFSIREKAGHINISLDTGKIPTQVTGRLFKNGAEVRFGREILMRSNPQQKPSGIAHLALVNLRLKIDTVANSVAVVPDGSGLFVSHPNPRQRLYQAREGLQRLRAEQHANPPNQPA